MKTQKLCAEVQISEVDYETVGIAETIEKISKKGRFVTIQCFG
jgi:hypothetical protein